MMPVVLDVLDDRLRGPRVLHAEQREKHDADRSADRAREQQPAAHAGQRRAGDEQQRRRAG